MPSKNERIDAVVAGLDAHEKRELEIWHAYLRELAEKRQHAPYPFCRHPERCIAVGRCTSDPCCAD